MIHNRNLMISLLAAASSVPATTGWSLAAPVPEGPRLDGRPGPAPIGHWRSRRRSSKKYKVQNRKLQRAGRRAARKGRKK